jgi:hypothetical protein
MNLRPGYNFNGDKSMVSVIINAKFDNNPPNPHNKNNQTTRNNQNT